MGAKSGLHIHICQTRKFELRKLFIRVTIYSSRYLKKSGYLRAVSFLNDTQSILSTCRSFVLTLHVSYDSRSPGHRSSTLSICNGKTKPGCRETQQRHGVNIRTQIKPMVVMSCVKPTGLSTAPLYSSKEVFEK